MQPESTNGDAEPDSQSDPTAPFTPTFTGAMPALTEEAPSEPQPVVADEPVASTVDRYLKRWTFVLVVVATWVVAAAVGLGLFYWWFHSINKTPAVFIVLVYLVMCIVAALDRGDGAGPAADVRVEHRAALGAVRVDGRGGGALRRLLLRSRQPLSDRRHPLLMLAG